MESIIEVGTIKDVEPWAQLRAALWPHHSLDDHRAEMSRAFLSESGEAIGTKLWGLLRPLCGMIM